MFNKLVNKFKYVKCPECGHRTERGNFCQSCGHQMRPTWFVKPDSKFYALLNRRHA